MPHEANLKYISHMNLVITVAEAAAWYGVDRKTIMYAIDANNIIARKSAGTWLVSVASLMEFWGRPTKTVPAIQFQKYEKLLPNSG